MKAIRIRKKLDSETLNLPELRPLVEQTIEIIVLERSRSPAFGLGPAIGRSSIALPEKLRITISRPRESKIR